MVRPIGKGEIYRSLPLGSFVVDTTPFLRFFFPIRDGPLVSNRFRLVGGFFLSSSFFPGGFPKFPKPPNPGNPRLYRHERPVGINLKKTQINKQTQRKNKSKKYVMTDTPTTKFK